MSDEFSLEAVRQFMIDSGGKVKNNQLVTRFKSFLNDPASKGNGAHSHFVNPIWHEEMDSSLTTDVRVLKNNTT